ncbi:hypothetical protein CsSME_00042127 [Camellia sinensis var. sinensis]
MLGVIKGTAQSVCLYSVTPTWRWQQHSLAFGAITALKERGIFAQVWKKGEA